MLSSRPMHQIRKCILLHFGYTPGVTLFLYMLPPMKSFIVMTQSRLANGVTRASRYSKKPSTMNVQGPAVANNVPNSTESTRLSKATKRWRIQDNREQDLQGREVSDGEDLCRGLVAPGAALVGCHGGLGGLGGLPERPRAVGYLSRRVAVAEQRPDRHRPILRLAIAEPDARSRSSGRRHR